MEGNFGMNLAYFPVILSVLGARLLVKNTNNGGKK
jgi:hypothetical protein